MQAIPEDLLRAANRDPGTRGRVRRDADRVPIVCDGRVAGFYTPHRDRSGAIRLGPVYILPEFRGRGLVSDVYRTAPGPVVACVEAWNVASERMLERAGFVRWRRYAHGWYWRRA